MLSIKRLSIVSLIVPGLILIAAFGVVLAKGAAAARPAAREPAVVVTISLSRVLTGLNARGEAEAALQAMNDQLREEEQQWRADLEGLKSRLEALPDDDEAARRPIAEEAALKALQFQEWQRYRGERRDIEKSLLWRDLYRTIREAVARMCESQGYEIVLLYDGAEELVVNPQSPLSSEDQVKQQMMNRQILHAVPAVDVTDELIDRMNNSY